MRERLAEHTPKGTSDLSAAERWGLKLLVCDAVWPESRRWLAGYANHGTCNQCFQDIGTSWHAIVECGATLDSVTRLRVEGRSLPKERDLVDPALAPLVVRGLPPRSYSWSPREPAVGRQTFGHDIEGKVFGDGSAIQAGDPECGVAAWSIVRQRYDAAAQDAECSGVNSGIVHGWFPTAPRSEISAYIDALSNMCLTFEYVGDCQHVIDIARQGIPLEFTSSMCFNADLWRRARALLHDHGVEAVAHTKTKAHRTKAAAEASDDGAGGPLEHWLGNRTADIMAKSLAKSTFDADAVAARAKARDWYSLVLTRVACAVAFLVKQAPEADGRRKGRRRINFGSPDGGPHELQSRTGGGWECTKCRLFGRTEAAVNSLRYKDCKGDIVRQCHCTHVLDWTSGFLFCRKCGSYTSRLPRALRARCPGGPASEAAANVLRRLRSGLPPTTAAYAGEVVRSSRRDDDAHTVEVARGHGLSSQEMCDAMAGITARRRGRQPGDAAIPVEGSAGRAAPREASGTTTDNDPSSTSARRRTINGAPQFGRDDEPVLRPGAVQRDAEPDLRHRPATLVHHLSSPSDSRSQGTSPPPPPVRPSAHGAQAHDLSSDGRRRRITGKSRPNRTASTGPRRSLEEAASDLRGNCSSHLMPSWTRRICIDTSWMKANCTACSKPTPARCRSCSAAVCVACAKVSKPCIVESASNSPVADAVARPCPSHGHVESPAHHDDADAALPSAASRTSIVLSSCQGLAAADAGADEMNDDGPPPCHDDEHGHTDDLQASRSASRRLSVA